MARLCGCPHEPRAWLCAGVMSDPPGRRTRFPVVQLVFGSAAVREISTYWGLEAGPLSGLN